MGEFRVVDEDGPGAALDGAVLGRDRFIFVDDGMGGFRIVDEDGPGAALDGAVLGRNGFMVVDDGRGVGGAPVTSIIVSKTGRNVVKILTWFRS